MSGTGPKEIESKERREQALRMRAAGFTYDKIGKALSITRQRAHAIVKSELSLIDNETRESREEIRTLMNERYDSMIQRLWFKAMPPTTPENSNPDLNISYMSQLLRIMESQGKLNGVEAPTKAEEDWLMLQGASSKLGLLILRFVPEEDRDRFLVEMDRVIQTEQQNLLEA